MPFPASGDDLEDLQNREQEQELPRAWRNRTRRDGLKEGRDR